MALVGTSRTLAQNTACTVPLFPLLPKFLPSLLFLPAHHCPIVMLQHPRTQSSQSRRLRMAGRTVTFFEGVRRVPAASACVRRQDWWPFPIRVLSLGFGVEIGCRSPRQRPNGGAVMLYRRTRVTNGELAQLAAFSRPRIEWLVEWGPS